MESINNDIDSGNFSKRNNNGNDNGEIRRNRVDNLATHCCEKMGNRGDRVAYKLYCKAFYQLSESCVWECVELATNKGRIPAKYLSWLLTRELNKM